MGVISLMHRYFAIAVLALAVAFAGYAQSNRKVDSGPHTFYSKDQAEHGKTLYGENCSKCHLENLKGNCPGENLSELSYVCSTRGSAPPYWRRFHAALLHCGGL